MRGEKDTHLAQNVEVEMDNYKLEIIVNGYCKSIVPAAEVEGEIAYSLDELEPVDFEMNVMASLKFLKSVVEIIEDLEDHLIFQGEYSLSLDNFFYSKRFDRYYLRYFEGDDIFLDFLGKLKPNDYLIDIEAEIKKKHPSNKQLLELIENKSQEAYHCELF